MEEHPALERKEILSHAVTWMNSDNIMLKEMLSHKISNSVWLHSHEVSKAVEAIEVEGRMVATWSRKEGENEGFWFNGYRVLVLQDEKFWKSVAHYLALPNCRLKMVKVIILCCVFLTTTFLKV